MNREQKTLAYFLVKYVFILIGSLLTAAGIGIFFQSHNLIGGGVIGAAVILSYLTEIPLSAVAVIFNFPFLLIGYRQKGKGMVVPTLFAMAATIYWMSVLNPSMLEAQDILQSTIFGGLLLGTGSGLILRCGGYIDGMEHQRAHFKKQFSNEASGVFILVNLLTICAAGMVFGWERAMYSIGAYFIVFKLIDIITEISEKTKRVIILSDKADEIAEFIYERLGTCISKPNKGSTKKSKLSFHVSHHEIAYLKSIIHDVDHEAQIYVDSKVQPRLP